MSDFDDVVRSLKERRPDDEDDESRSAPSPYAMFLEMRQQTTAMWSMLDELREVSKVLREQRDQSDNMPRPSPS